MPIITHFTFLFIYEEKGGNYNKIRAKQVNQYLKDKLGKDFTCKDFRTYTSNIYFNVFLSSLGKILKKL